MEYMVSFFAKRPEESTVKHKWWQIWKKPLYIRGDTWKQYSMLLEEDEAQLLINSDMRSPQWRLLVKAIAGVGVDNADKVQIEELTAASPMVKAWNTRDR